MRKPRTNGRAATKDGNATRERILDAATQLLQDEGVVGISTRRVAQLADANQALIHYYFGSIDNLMYEVVGRIADRFVAQYERAFSESGSYIDKWRAEIDAVKADSNGVRQQKVWFEAMAVVINDPAKTERYRELQRTRTRSILERAVTDELQRHNPAADVEPEAEAISALLSLVRTGLTIDVLLGSTKGHDAALALVEELLESRLQPQPNPPRKRSRGPWGPSARQRRR